VTSPVLLADPVLLEAEREELLGDDVPWLGWCGDRLDKAPAPRQQQPSREQQVVLSDRQEQAVPDSPGPAPGPPETLQEAGDTQPGVDLDDPVKVTDVNSEF
jgi:hypothetical protein